MAKGEIIVTLKLSPEMDEIFSQRTKLLTDQEKRIRVLEEKVETLEKE